LFDRGRNTTHHSGAAKVSSIATPSAFATFRLLFLKYVIFAVPASEAQSLETNSCEEHSADVAPKTVTDKAMTHFL